MIIDKSAVQGELPDSVFDEILWGKLDWFVREALLAQPAAPRRLILEQGNTVEFEMSPFDGDGWSLIRMAGQPLLRLHVIGLMRETPLVLDAFGAIE